MDLFRYSLTQEEALMCEARAKWNVQNSKSRGLKDYSEKNTYVANRMGAGGEIALARILGVPWEKDHGKAYKRRKEGDLPGRVEVRAVSSRSPRLFVNERDHLHRAFALMNATKDLVTYDFVGWMRAIDVRRYGSQHVGGGVQREMCWYVEAAQLRDPYEMCERFAIWLENLPEVKG